MSVGRLSIASVGDGCTPDIMTSILVPGDTMTERTHDQGNRSTVNRRSDATQPNLVCPERASDRAMTDEEKSEVILAVARLLYTNGQATDQVVAVIRRLANRLGINAELLPHWGELQLHVRNGETMWTLYAAADPVGIDMHRVASAMEAVMDIETAGFHLAKRANGSTPSLARQLRRHGCLPWRLQPAQSRWQSSSASNICPPRSSSLLTRARAACFDASSPK